MPDNRLPEEIYDPYAGWSSFAKSLSDTMAKNQALKQQKELLQYQMMLNSLAKQSESSMSYEQSLAKMREEARLKELAELEKFNRFKQFGSELGISGSPSIGTSQPVTAGVQGMESMPSRTTGTTGFQKPQLQLTSFNYNTGPSYDVETPSEKANRLRLDLGEGRRQKQFDYNILYQMGGIKTEEELLDLGLSPDEENYSGRATVSYDKQGNKIYKFLSNTEYVRQNRQQTLSPKEKQFLDDMSEENINWRYIKHKLNKMGINENTVDQLGKIEWKEIMTPFGPISLPARFNLIGQYTQNDEYTTLKRNLEQTFAIFRKRITGAQASVEELEYLRELMPAPIDKPSVMLATIDDLINRNDTVVLDRFRNWELYGRDVKKLKGEWINKQDDFLPANERETKPSGKGIQRPTRAVESKPVSGDPLGILGGKR